MARLSFRCAEELVARVDAAREHEPREHWLRRAVERALEPPKVVGPGAASRAESGVPPAPAEQPEAITRRLVAEGNLGGVPPREFRPYPKGGKR